MPRHTPRAVAGMTLVELLVVVAILGMLAVTVLPNLAGADGQREVRIAAGAVSSQLTRGPSLAIEQRRSAGVWLEPLAANPAACIDVFSAIVPTPYRGDSFDAAFEVAPNPFGVQADLVPSPNSAAVASLATLGDFSASGNLIQFNDSGPLFEIRAGGTSSPYVALLRNLSGQSASNTIWPAPDPATHPFAIFRLPTRMGQPLVLSGGAAIDLAWSGMGTTRFSSAPLQGDDSNLWSRDSNFVPGSKIVILFDSAGSASELCYVAISSGQTRRLPITGPVYLLVGRLDRCGLPFLATPTKQNPGANWQYPDSFWVGIDPQSGIVKVTEVVPNSTTCLQSQGYIRTGLTAVRL